MNTRLPVTPHRGVPFGGAHCLPDSVASALPDVPLDPTKWQCVLEALLAKHNWAHGTRPKNVSFKTMQSRRRFLYSFFRELRQDPETKFFIDPRSLRHRHVLHSVRRWIERGLSAGAIKNNLSHLRVFSGWIGKRGMVMDPEKYVDDPLLVKRTTVATSDRSWSAHGVDVPELRSRIADVDPFVAAQVFMCQAFGLRVKEAIMCRPHHAVVDDCLVLVDALDLTTYLEVKRGTKGGRRRRVAIDSDLKWEALEHAKSVVQRPDDSLADPRLSLKQAYRRFFYVLGVVGVTRAELGVTAHGLRHQYANDKFEQLTGVPSPVRGGPPIPGDEEARIAVAQDLGHARKQITSAYLGGLLRSVRDAGTGNGASDGK